MWYPAPSSGGGGGGGCDASYVMSALFDVLLKSNTFNRDCVAPLWRGLRDETKAHKTGAWVREAGQTLNENTCGACKSTTREGDRMLGSYSNHARGKNDNSAPGGVRLRAMDRYHPRRVRKLWGMLCSIFRAGCVLYILVPIEIPILDTSAGKVRDTYPPRTTLFPSSSPTRDVEMFSK